MNKIVLSISAAFLVFLSIGGTVSAADSCGGPLDCQPSSSDISCDYSCNQYGWNCRPRCNTTCVPSCGVECVDIGTQTCNLCSNYSISDCKAPREMPCDGQAPWVDKGAPYCSGGNIVKKQEKLKCGNLECKGKEESGEILVQACPCGCDPGATTCKACGPSCSPKTEDLCINNKIVKRTTAANCSTSDQQTNVGCGCSGKKNEYCDTNLRKVIEVWSKPDCTDENRITDRVCGETPKKKICQNNQCVQVEGTGSNQCDTNAQCEPPPYYGCENSQCVRKPGPGSDHEDCTDHQIGKVCGVTPTPGQRQEESAVSKSDLNSGSQANQAGATDRGRSSTVYQDGIQFVCLKAEPCSTNPGLCSNPEASGHDPGHTVRLSRKNDALPKPGEGDIVECLSVPSGGPNTSTPNVTICTSSDTGRDNDLFGSYRAGQSNLAYLSSRYGYLKNPSSGIKVTVDGNRSFPSFEWESKTTASTQQYAHTFYIVQPIGSGTEGNVGGGGLVQGNIGFTEDNTSKNCLKIFWDPYGHITDAITGKAVAGATVTIFGRNELGVYVPLDPALVFNLKSNPIQTEADGYYNFYVPPGEYKIEVKAPGYKKFESAPFVEKDRSTELHVQMHRKTYLDEILNLLGVN